jgi:hypothetical protein
VIFVTSRSVEILILQALAQQMQGDIPAALAPLQRALTLAEPEGCMPSGGRLYDPDNRPAICRT